jgi:hypothetical protein
VLVLRCWFCCLLAPLLILPSAAAAAAAAAAACEVLVPSAWLRRYKIPNLGRRPNDGPRPRSLVHPVHPVHAVPPWFKALLACWPVGLHAAGLATCGPPSPLRLPQLKPRFHCESRPPPTRRLVAAAALDAAAMLPPICPVPESPGHVPCSMFHVPTRQSPVPGSHVPTVAPRDTITYIMYCPI